MTAEKTVDEPWSPSVFVVFVKTGRASCDAVVVQQSGRATSIFGGDKVNLSKNLERSQCDVFKVSDGRGDQIKRARHNETGTFRGAPIVTFGEFIRSRTSSPRLASRKTE